MGFTLEQVNKTLGLINWNNSIFQKLFFKRVCIDSRDLKPDDLFVAIKGNRYDGHDFIYEAISKGAKAVVLNKDVQTYPEKFPYWEVPNTIIAFQKLALFKRKELNIPVIAITGSVGKTTTKEMAGSVLGKFGRVKISKENFNNEIGVALTILSCNERDKLLVLEMGMRGLGQIENLSKFSEPNIAIITNIGTSHIGILGSKYNIAKAKCEITSHLKRNGTLIIPSDNKILDQNLKDLWNGRIVRVKLLSIHEFNKFRFPKEDVVLGFYDSSNNNIKIDNKDFQITFKGRHNAMNFLYVYALAREFGMKFEAYNFFDFTSLKGRNRIVKKEKVTILDETYNASPESVMACIDVLLSFPGRHFLILGSIKELGDKTIKYHLELMDFIEKSNLDGFIFLCEEDLEKKLKKLCIFKKEISFVRDIDQISFIVNSWLNYGDYLLIKGSRYWKLEKLISQIN